MEHHEKMKVFRYYVDSAGGEIGDLSYLAEEADGGLRGIWNAPDDWDGDQDSYDNHLIELHVEDADGEWFQDADGNSWYKHGADWQFVADDGRLHYRDGGPQ